jgi:hypothetical protein
MEDKTLLKLVKLNPEGVLHYKQCCYVVIKGKILNQFSERDYYSAKVAELLAISEHFDLTYEVIK